MNAITKSDIARMAAALGLQASFWQPTPDGRRAVELHRDDTWTWCRPFVSFGSFSEAAQWLEALQPEEVI